MRPPRAAILPRLAALLPLLLAGGIAIGQPPGPGEPRRGAPGEKHRQPAPPAAEAPRGPAGPAAQQGRAVRTRRFAQGLLRTQWEARRLERNAEELAEERARLAADTELDAERRERRERILDLKAELLDLERDEFVAVTRRVTASLVERIDEADLEGPEADAAADARPRLLRIRDAATDFPTLSRALREEENAFQAQGSGAREELRRREMEVLEERLRRLRDGDGWPEIQTPPRLVLPLGPDHRGPEGLRQKSPPPPPEDAALMPGLPDGPPEPGRRRPGPPPVD